jgi:hypothetical protein
MLGMKGIATIELVSRTPITPGWSRELDDVEMGRSAISQQDPTSFIVMRKSLPEFVDSVDHVLLYQDARTSLKGVLQKHSYWSQAGQLVNGSKSWFFCLRVSAPSLAWVRNRGEGLPLSQSTTNSVARAAAFMGAETA